jgi:hypothetical protein
LHIREFRVAGAPCFLINKLSFYVFAFFHDLFYLRLHDLLPHIPTYTYLRRFLCLFDLGWLDHNRFSLDNVTVNITSCMTLPILCWPEPTILSLERTATTSTLWTFSSFRWESNLWWRTFINVVEDNSVCRIKRIWIDVWNLLVNKVNCLLLRRLIHDQVAAVDSVSMLLLPHNMLCSILVRLCTLKVSRPRHYFVNLLVVLVKPQLLLKLRPRILNHSKHPDVLLLDLQLLSLLGITLGWSTCSSYCSRWLSIPVHRLRGYSATKSTSSRSWLAIWHRIKRS